MTPDEKKAEEFEKFLASLTTRSEIFGLLGRGFPNSFYTVYVRPEPTQKWWRVSWKSAMPVAYDPMQKEGEIEVKERCGAVWGPICYLRVYGHMPGPALDRLVSRANELTGDSTLNELIGLEE